MTTQIPQVGDSLRELTEIMRDVSRQTSPNGVYSSFASRFWRIRRPIERFVSLSVRNLEPGQYKITRSHSPGELRSIVDEEGGLTRVREHIEQRNPWRDWARLPAHTGGWIGSVIERPEPQLLGSIDVSDDPVLGDIVPHARSAMVIPIYENGEALNWAIQFRNEPDGFNESELQEAILTTNLFGAATRNLLAHTRAAQLNDQLNQQFDEIVRIQQALLPERTPKIPGLAIATSYLTSNRAGGDYYDFFELAGGRWGILLADVAGHGAGAATVMAMMHGILHAYPDIEAGPARVMDHVNARLCAARLESRFVTAFYGEFDPDTRELTFVRAGHPQPRIKNVVTGEVRVLEGADGLPLGVLEEHRFEQATVRLEPGQTVVLYTDGVTEAAATGADQDGRMFGTEGLDAALQLCTGEADCVIDVVNAGLYAFTGTRQRSDDQTLVAMQVLPAEGGP